MAASSFDRLLNMDMSAVEARVLASPQFSTRALEKAARLGATYGMGATMFVNSIRGMKADYVVHDEFVYEMADEDYRWWRALKEFFPHWQNDIDRQHSTTDPYHHVKQRVRKAARSHGRHHRKAAAAMAWMVADRLNDKPVFQGTTTGRMGGKTKAMGEAIHRAIQTSVTQAKQAELAMKIEQMKLDDMVDSLSFAARAATYKTP